MKATRKREPRISSEVSSGQLPVPGHVSGLVTRLVLICLITNISS